MSLEEDLKKTTLKKIENLDLYSLPLSCYARSYHQILALLYENQILDDASIEMALEKAVISYAKKYYDSITLAGSLPIFLNGCKNGESVSQNNCSNGATSIIFTKCSE